MKTVILALSILLFATLQGQSDADAIHLKVTEPEAGATYNRDFTLNASVSIPAGREYDVKVRCFQTTHWHLLTPGQPFSPKPNAEGRVKWGIRDDFFLPQEGDQVLQIDIYELRNGVQVDPDKPVASLQVPFRFVPATKEELAKDLADRSNYLSSPAVDLAKHVLDPRTQWTFQKKPNEYQERSRDGKLQSDASGYITDRSREFFARTNAYAGAAQIYDPAGHPGAALRALRRAQEIYETEQNVLLSGPGFQNWPIIWEYSYSADPPFYLNQFYFFYARRKDLAQAVAWQKAVADFWLRQGTQHPSLEPDRKERCISIASGSYIGIAKLHYLLNHDRSAYDSWMRKREQTYRAAKERSLLDWE